jgi:hypothetical protein
VVGIWPQGAGVVGQFGLTDVIHCAGAAFEKGAEIGSPTLAHPFRWRLRNVGVRDGGIIRLPDAGASVTPALEREQK